LMIAMDPNGGQADPNAALGGAAVRGNVVIIGGPPAQGMPSSQRFVTVRLKRGEKNAKTLKELTGSLNAEALTDTEALVSIDNILKAAGKSAKAKDGGSLQVQSVDKLANGDIQVKIAMENLGGQNFFRGMPGGVVIQGQAVVQFRQIQIGGNGMAMQ